MLKKRREMLYVYNIFKTLKNPLTTDYQ